MWLKIFNNNYQKLKIFSKVGNEIGIINLETISPSCMLTLRKILFFLFFSCSNSIHFPVHQKDPFHNLHGINTRRYFCYDWYGNGHNHMNCECFVIRCCTDPQFVWWGSAEGTPSLRSTLPSHNSSKNHIGFCGR